MRAKLGAWRNELERLLLANAAKPARERLTLGRVFEALRAIGYKGGYEAIRQGVTIVLKGLAGEAETDRLCHELGTSHDVPGHFEVADMADPDTITAMIERISRSVGPMDLLVNDRVASTPRRWRTFRPESGISFSPPICRRRFMRYVRFCPT